MQSARQVWLAAAAALGLFGICDGADRPTPAANVQAAPAASSAPVASGNQLQLGRRRIGQAYAAGSTNPAPVGEAPPVPVDSDAPTTDAAPPVAAPSQVVMPRIPFMAPPGASAIHERLRAKRLARVQQMKQQAQQNGDTQGVERAQYLEGMVNELHNKGLFNFGQKVMSAMQEGKLQGLTGGASGSTPASGSAEMPDTDLGTASPLPDVELGESAPVPTDGAAETPKANPTPEAGPQLPPSDAPADGGDAPPAK